MTTKDYQKDNQKDYQKDYRKDYQENYLHVVPVWCWIDNIKSLILSYIVNSQTCELERNAKLIGLSGQPSVYTGVHPSRERSAALTPPVGSSGHCLSSAEQKGAASILDKGGIHVGSWRHPC